MKIGNLIVSREDLIVKHFGHFSIESIGNKAAINTMAIGNRVLKEIGVPYWISSGNLLGIYRDGKLISHDTDIDFGVRLNWRLHNEPVFKQIANGLTANRHSLIRTVECGRNLMQMAFMDQINDVISDIYFFYTGIIPNHAVNVNPEGIIRYPLKFISNLSELEFGGVTYPIPDHIEDFLVWRFGEDWQIPKTEKRPWQEESPHLEAWK